MTDFSTLDIVAFANDFNQLCLMANGASSLDDMWNQVQRAIEKVADKHNIGPDPADWRQICEMAGELELIPPSATRGRPTRIISNGHFHD